MPTASLQNPKDDHWRNAISQANIKMIGIGLHTKDHPNIKSNYKHFAVNHYNLQSESAKKALTRSQDLDTLINYDTLVRFVPI